MGYSPYGRGYGRGGGWGSGRGPGWMPPQQTMPPIPPPPADVLRVVASTDDPGGLNARISFRFARAPFLTIVDLKDGKVIKAESLENKMAMGLRGVGVGVGQWLISSGAKVVLAPRLGPNIMMVLSQAGIRVETVPPGVPVIEALKRLNLIY